MLDDSSSTPKGAPRRAHVPPIHLYRLFRLPAARWVQWTRTVAMAPARRSCDLSKSSPTKRRRPRSLPRAHARHPCLRQRQKVPMAVVTRARTTSRRCAPRGAFAAEMIVGMMEMMGRRMENVKRMKMALEIYAWRVRSLTRGRATTFLPSRVPSRFALLHVEPPIFSHSQTSLIHIHTDSPHPTVKYSRPVLPSSIFHLLSFPSAFPFFLPSFLLHYTACVHDVYILNTLNIRWQKLVSLSLRFTYTSTCNYNLTFLLPRFEGCSPQQITFEKRTNCH